MNTIKKKIKTIVAQVLNYSRKKVVKGRNPWRFAQRY
jgi:hypothetical protein